VEYQDYTYCYNMRTTNHNDQSKLNIYKTYTPPPHFNVSGYPDSMDWRTKGAVGSDKNQVCKSSKRSFIISGIAHSAQVIKNIRRLCECAIKDRTS